MYNECNLRAAMTKKRMTIKDVAQKIGLSPTGFFNKLSGARDFTIPEVAKLTAILDLSESERNEIFFANDGD